MRKLSLDTVAVQSFPTGPVPLARGTVRARARTNAPGCGGGGDTTGCGLATFETECTLNAEVCGDTNYLECTYGCSLDTACGLC